MLDFNASQLNEVFLQAIQDESMLKEAESKGAEYLKLQIYEDSFMERILPAQSIAPEQCDRDVNSPNYQVVIDKEYTDVTAVTTSFRGRSDYQYVETERYAVQFHKIESPEYSVTEGELRGMRQPLQNLIRHHIAYYIRKKMDESFIGMCNHAVSSSGLEIDRTGTGDDQISPELLIDLRNLIDGQNEDGRYLKASTLLMTQPMYNTISNWVQSNTSAGAGTQPGMAGGLTSEFWRDGYKYDQLFGMRVIKTMKSDLISEKELFLFTEPEYLGHHFTFNDDRFSIEHQHDILRWKGFRTFGSAIGNENAVAKLTLA